MSDLNPDETGQSQPSSSDTSNPPAPIPACHWPGGVGDMMTEALSGMGVVTATLEAAGLPHLASRTSDLFMDIVSETGMESRETAQKALNAGLAISRIIITPELLRSGAPAQCCGDCADDTEDDAQQA